MEKFWDIVSWIFLVLICLAIPIIPIGILIYKIYDRFRHRDKYEVRPNVLISKCPQCGKKVEGKKSTRKKTSSTNTETYKDSEKIGEIKTSSGAKFANIYHDVEKSREIETVSAKCCYKFYCASCKHRWSSASWEEKTKSYTPDYIKSRVADQIRKNMDNTN